MKRVNPRPLAILDFDGVIRDSRRASHAAAKAALKAAGLKTVFSADEYWRMRGYAEFNNRFKALGAIYSVAVSGKRLRNLLRTAPESILALEKKHPAPEALLGEMREVNKKVSAMEILRSPFGENARRGLEKLGKAAVVAVVSDSGRRGVMKWVRAKKLTRFFKIILCREDVPEMKPSPKGILAVLGKMRARPGENVFYAGDAQCDILAARAAGVKAVGLACGMASEKMLWKAGADSVFSDLLGFADWLGNGSGKKRGGRGG
ncbi:MAG: HAD hydrolase-like protein [Candidatus Micrarchaeota archaeon]|nr:HAD hydrolase-like protein [Candidatus Micrarchaeota archaeon]